MHDKRVKNLNNLNISSKGKYVLYWMQQSSHVSYNHALNYAVEANERHYYFLLEGLSEVKDTLETMGINFFLKKEIAVPLVQVESDLIFSF